ncbi:MAG: hypothetical protein Q9185_003885 [Variospora sp. 1 TL-2023]
MKRSVLPPFPKRSSAKSELPPSFAIIRHHHHHRASKMISRSALRASQAARPSARPSAMLARRGFHSSPARFESPYHYAEGPYSNIPFNPKTKYFAVRYWGTMG